ncbi:MAG: adenosylcobinamide-GDP ribazoletransferase [Defluviimonas sp.]|nr:adenosylcobinamide-GDP ribazoletransferase [Defluviimonas sp.]
MNGRRIEEFRLAVMFLTRLPAGRLSGAPKMADSAWAWPIVGAGVGAIAALAAASALWLGMSPAMAALVALAAGALVTGAMHEDGLGDVADGFGGGDTAARKLDIMRDSRVGSYGVLAIVLAMLFRAEGIATALGHGIGAAALIGLAAASRACLPALLALMPAARTDGLGRAAAKVAPRTARAALAMGALCLLPLGFETALAVAVAMALAATSIAVLALRQIGGQTGDVMGAAQILAEIAGWATLAAMCW